MPPSASSKHERELGAFARYCAQRIERDIGERQQWLVEIALAKHGYATIVQVHHLGRVFEVHGEGSDGPLAIWDAMCRLEQALLGTRINR